MKKKWTLEQKRNLKGFLFVTPYLFGLIFLFLVPLGQSLLFSFGDVSLNTETGRYQFIWSGLANYSRALFDELVFVSTLKGALTSLMMNVPVILVVSFLIAVLLKDKFPGRGIYRMLFFLPVILTAGILPSIDSTDILQGLIGSGMTVTVDAKNSAANLISTEFLSKLFLQMNISPSVVNYLTNAVRNIIVVVNNSGIQILIFLAGLQTISPSLYEAARVEGATSWEVFWKITVPMISPQILIVVIYTIIDSFVNVNSSLMQMISKVGFDKFQVGYSAAMTWMFFFIIILIVALVYAICSRFVFYNNRER